MTSSDVKTDSKAIIIIHLVEWFGLVLLADFLKHKNKYKIKLNK